MRLFSAPMCSCFHRRRVRHNVVAVSTGGTVCASRWGLMPRLASIGILAKCLAIRIVWKVSRYIDASMNRAKTTYYAPIPCHMRPLHNWHHIKLCPPPGKGRGKEDGQETPDSETWSRKRGRWGTPGRKLQPWRSAGSGGELWSMAHAPSE